MIHLKFLGHIKTSMGSEEMEILRESISVDDLFGLLLSKSPAEVDHGFSKFNTLLVVNEDEVFSASSQKERRLSDGDSVILVPFSHGG
jgi:molybdopterin converting factor small subunit